MRLFSLVKLGGIICWMGITLLRLDFLGFSQEVTTVEKDPAKVFSGQDQGHILGVRPGESFMLILPNPGSGGYLVQDPEFDSQILTLQRKEKKPPSDPDRGGDFGSFEWTFLAKQEGRCSLIVRAFRPWEKDKPRSILFSATVEVGQKTSK